MTTRFGVISRMLEWLEDRRDLAYLRKARAEDDGVRYSCAQVLEELAKMDEQE